MEVFFLCVDNPVNPEKKSQNDAPVVVGLGGNDLISFDPIDNQFSKVSENSK